MTSIGWEVWGVKFDLFLIVLLSLISFFMIRLSAGNSSPVSHTDQMAGDEGED